MKFRDVKEIYYLLSCYMANSSQARIDALLRSHDSNARRTWVYACHRSRPEFAVNSVKEENTDFDRPSDGFLHSPTAKAIGRMPRILNDVASKMLEHRTCRRTPNGQKKIIKRSTTKTKCAVGSSRSIMVHMRNGLHARMSETVIRIRAPTNENANERKHTDFPC